MTFARSTRPIGARVSCRHDPPQRPERRSDKPLRQPLRQRRRPGCNRAPSAAANATGPARPRHRSPAAGRSSARRLDQHVDEPAGQPGVWLVLQQQAEVADRPLVWPQRDRRVKPKALPRHREQPSVLPRPGTHRQRTTRAGRPRGLEQAATAVAQNGAPTHPPRRRSDTARERPATIDRLAERGTTQPLEPRMSPSSTSLAHGILALASESHQTQGRLRRVRSGARSGESPRWPVFK